MTTVSTVLAFDLGTGGCKASLWRADGVNVASAVVEYPTEYPAPGRHEQDPEVWWRAVVASSAAVLSGFDGSSAGPVDAIALSGHSLGLVPLNARGDLLLGRTPIWSDSRGADAAREFFTRVSERDWYDRTGCGFPAALYPLFKLVWYRESHPGLFAETAIVLGSKDYVNFRLTGERGTDLSYASGSGALPTDAADYATELLEQAGVDARLLPRPRPSADLAGSLTSPAAKALGLPVGVPVYLGGVDNACMAAGAGSVSAGDTYLSLGSSSWVTTTTVEPVLDEATRPYTFRALDPALQISALSTFSSGVSAKWVRSLLGAAEPLSDDTLVELARQSEPGAHGLLFLPMLAGGSPIEGGSGVRGGLIGLDICHTKADVARACLEGVAMSVGRAFDRLAQQTDVTGPLLAVGGTARSDWLRQLYADVIGQPVTKTTVDQQAASLGAAATAFVGSGTWSGYAEVALAHRVEAEHHVNRSRHAAYASVRGAFERAVAGEVERTNA